MIDHPVPELALPSTGGKTVRFSELRGSPFVLYFYPKDNTPGCTTEGQNFRDLHPQFTDVGWRIFGVSRDSIKSHESFKTKMSFPFELLSDQDEKACSAFAVIKMKNMYGRQVRGIERSTFAVDAAGIVRGQWRGVKVPGHAQEVLDFVKSLSA
ncbi:MAG: redoxin domain-containing protein [Betaproteobacteria bacterium]|nr:redoxin domain-containing protein [Betaproteobacteria bacterium]